MKRCGIYVRVSTEKQATDDKTSLQDQEDRCRAWLEKLGGYEVVVVEKDAGVSGAKLRRPAFDRLIDMARNRQIDVVCIAKVDRLARDTKIDAMLQMTLNQFGVSVIFVDRDTESTAGRMMLGFEGMVAEMEKANIIDRLSSGKHNAITMKKQAIGSGYVAYGYRYNRRKDHLAIRAEIEARANQRQEVIADKEALESLATSSALLTNPTFAQKRRVLELL